MYYEDYGSNYNETIQGHLDFLSLKAVQENVAFEMGHTYQSLFDDENESSKARASTFNRRNLGPFEALLC